MGMWKSICQRCCSCFLPVSGNNARLPTLLDTQTPLQSIFEKGFPVGEQEAEAEGHDRRISCGSTSSGGVSVVDEGPRVDFQCRIEDFPDFLDAARYARYHSAFRQLVQFCNTGGDLSEIADVSTVERVHRIGAKFTEAGRFFQVKPENLKVNEYIDKLGLHWGMSLEGNIMQIVSVKDYDVDIMKMIAFDLRRDLEDKVSDDAIVQKSLGHSTPHDIPWRRYCVNKATGDKFDDFVMVSSINALHDAMQAFCALKYTLPVSATNDPFGNPIPAVEPGHKRTPYLMIATLFTPLAIGGDKMRGVRRFECTEVELPASSAKILKLMPGFVLKKVCRTKEETLAKQLTEALTSSRSDDILKAPYLEEFLAELRHDIQEMP